MICIVVRISTAVVNLDKVEVAITEVKGKVINIVTVETYANTDGVLRISPIRSTGVATCIGVDTRLEALVVNLVHQGAQAVREACGVDEQVALRITATEEAIIDVDMVISTILESEFHHRIGLRFQYRVVNLVTVGVP